MWNSKNFWYVLRFYVKWIGVCLWQFLGLQISIMVNLSHGKLSKYQFGRLWNYQWQKKFEIPTLWIILLVNTLKLHFLQRGFQDSLFPQLLRKDQTNEISFFLGKYSKKKFDKNLISWEWNSVIFILFSFLIYLLAYIHLMWPLRAQCGNFKIFLSPRSYFRVARAI